MAGCSSGNTSGGPSLMDRLTDDLLLEFFARVPYRSLRRFACVSRRWRDLITDPGNYRKLPQTLAGFFYSDLGRTLPYVPSTGPLSLDPSLSFLPDPEREGLRLVDGCNGLLLCRCYRFADSKEFDYLVINLATEKWVAVPISRRWSNKVQMARLGFEPAVSSHFHVFEFQFDWAEPENSDTEDDENSNSEDEEDGDGHVLGVKIYSSETGLWSNEQSNWSVDIKLNSDLNSVFVCGMLYVVATSSVIGAVDVDGRTWKIIGFPHDRNMVFFVFGRGKRLMSYDMNSWEVHMISHLGQNCFGQFVPYVPLFSESLADGQQ
ncbi:hypothetical protein QOZ80_5AG0391450 [Eleusine coracana subsp. coracana]|nr:hypothetical protein QOZ80_5AG0391450 [Eleusine coracana subsp. coracana]